MKKSLTLPLALMIFGASILGYSAIALKPKPERMPIFSQENRSFIQRKGGIDEKVLSSGVYETCKKHASEEKLKKSLEEAEAIEQKTEFLSLEDYRNKEDENRQKKDPHNWTPSNAYGLSELMTEISLNENRTLLRGLDSKEEKEHEPVKRLISKMDSLSQNTQNDMEKLVTIYNFLSEQLKPKDRKGSLTILQLLKDGNGNCNDLSPSYCAVLEHYGIKCELKMGVLKYEGKEEGHAWLRVNIDGHVFDLDPTWYKGFVPLEPRT